MKCNFVKPVIGTMYADKVRGSKLVVGAALELLSVSVSVLKKESSEIVTK